VTTIGIDDAYSILWRYLQDISFFTTIYTYIYETTNDHDHDHGRIVSRVLLATWLTLLINTQPTGVKPTSDPTNLFLLMEALTDLASQ